MQKEEDRKILTFCEHNGELCVLVNGIKVSFDQVEEDVLRHRIGLPDKI